MGIVLAITLAPKDMALVVLGVVAVVAFVGWFFRKDDKIEGRRKLAVDAAKVLAEEGYEFCAEACNQYAIGDYSGFLGTLRELVRQLLNPQSRLSLLRKPFRKQLVTALGDEEERAWVLKTIDDWKAMEIAKAEKGVAEVAQGSGAAETS